MGSEIFGVIFVVCTQPLFPGCGFSCRRGHMAGVGGDCGRHRPGRKSCLADGLIDVRARRGGDSAALRGQRKRKECGFVNGVTTGVMCCRRPDRWQRGQYHHYTKAAYHFIFPVYFCFVVVSGRSQVETRGNSVPGSLAQIDRKHSRVAPQCRDCRGNGRSVVLW